jgi:tetratricopeptide (TPR) repeat protein
MKPFLAAVLMWVGGAATAEIPPVPAELDELALTVMRDAPTREEVLARAVQVDATIARLADPAARDLFTAMRQFLVGFAIRGTGGLVEAEEYFERAIELAKRANARTESSEGHRVLADGYNQLLDLGGSGYKLFNVGRARRAAVTAVELDGSNPLAHATAAGFFVNAPAIAGGDPERARAHLDAAGRLAGDSQYLRFLVSVWDAHLARADGAQTAAQAAIDRAHAIFPRNWWLAEVAVKLDLELPTDQQPTDR